MILLLSTLAFGGPHGDHARSDGPRAEHRKQMREDHPELVRIKAELDAAEAQLKLLVLDYRDADEKDQDALRGQIEDQAGVMYDLKTEAHAIRLQVLEEKLESARSELDERDDKRDERVQKWIEDNLDE